MTVAPFLITAWIALLTSVGLRWTSPDFRRRRQTRRSGRALRVTYVCPHCGREIARKVRTRG